MVNTDDEKKKKSGAKYWHPQQEKILKTWGEQSACSRWMHYKADEKFKKLSMGFTLPIIVISTVTGTANFAQETFPDSWKVLAPVVIGGLNLFAAILTTVLQFLKINELLESHRVSSIQYGKLSRQIRLQLTLPAYERSQHGDAVVENCSSEYDRLIEQSPPVPNEIIKLFQKVFPNSSEISTPNRLGLGGGKVKRKLTPLDITRPEIINITEISPYDSKNEENLAKNVFSALRRNSHPPLKNIVEQNKKDIVKELNSLKEKSLVQHKKELHESEIIKKKEVEDEKPPTIIQNTEPEHVTIEVSKVSEAKKLFDKR
jgi:hypothetical protein